MALQVPLHAFIRDGASQPFRHRCIHERPFTAKSTASEVETTAYDSVSEDVTGVCSSV